MNSFYKFLKDWMLVISIITGVCLYLLYHSIPSIHSAGPALEYSIKKLQPALLFMMLFLSFCKVTPSQMKPRRWMAWHLLIQGGLFVLLALVLAMFPNIRGYIAIEAFMLCIICPTATACAVVTGKLGGDMAGVVTYTVLINLLTAIVVPLMVPLIHPSADMTFFSAFIRILMKVFPLLIMPCLAAWLVRWFLPDLHKRILNYTDLSFYIWAFSLMLAILMSTRAIVHETEGVKLLAEIAIASALSCVLQFGLGKMIGRRYGCEISAGQALGQKNTVFGIWMGYTFMTPLTSVAGGFYSIWHNVFNTWQLYKKRKADEAGV